MEKKSKQATPREQLIINIIKPFLYLLVISAISFIFIKLLTPADHGKKFERSRLVMLNGANDAMNGDYETAIEKFSSAIELDTSNSRAYVHRGRAYFRIKDYKKALSDLNKAASGNTTDSEAFLYLADVQYSLHDYEAALENYRKAVEIGPHPDAYIGMGTIYLEKGDTVGAVSCYSKAVEAAPTSSKAYILRGNIYKTQGLIDQALADFESAIANDPGNAGDDKQTPEKPVNENNR